MQHEWEIVLCFCKALIFGVICYCCVTYTVLTNVGVKWGFSPSLSHSGPGGSTDLSCGCFPRAWMNSQNRHIKELAKYLLQCIFEVYDSRKDEFLKPKPVLSSQGEVQRLVLPPKIERHLSGNSCYLFIYLVCLAYSEDRWVLDNEGRLS